jgi:hypothetical protein
MSFNDKLTKNLDALQDYVTQRHKLKRNESKIAEETETTDGGP